MIFFTKKTRLFHLFLLTIGIALFISASLLNWLAKRAFQIFNLEEGKRKLIMADSFIGMGIFLVSLGLIPSKRKYIKIFGIVGVIIGILILFITRQTFVGFDIIRNNRVR